MSINLLNSFIKFASAGSTVWYGDRGINFGGSKSGGDRVDNIDYENITSTSNASDFGNLAVATNYISGSVSNGTRGVMAGGNSASGTLDTIEYISTSSTGNTSSFGDLTTDMKQGSAGGNGTYCIWGGGET